MLDGTEIQAPNETRFSRIVHVESTGSTNEDLLAEAKRGETTPAVLVTDHQSAGRGRQRRVWLDTPGTSLLVSYRIACQPGSAHLLPLAAGLAVLDALADVGVASSVFGLKWPNDVLAREEPQPKLAGILVESVSAGSSFCAVVGVGLNLQAEPEEARSVGLADLAGGSGRRPIDRFALLERYLIRSEHQIARLERGERQPLLDDYRRACLTIRRSVQFQLAARSPKTFLTGIASGVDADGKLLITDESGRVHSLNAGEAHHI